MWAAEDEIATHCFRSVRNDNTKIQRQIPKMWEIEEEIVSLV